MSGQKLQVTLSATDQITPTTKTIISSLEQFLNQLKLTDAGLTGIQGKMRTAFAATGATQIFPTQQITQFSAGLNQVGIGLDATGGKVAGTQSKFASFGQTLMANGTAFGVAGASAFGLFNAIDNLEKVQLRAATATLRSSTAATALATAENALAAAKASGTASTEQLSVLELRVSDARERVAITTERATIFQQDYTEALAGLALQVGPQAIALGGSLAQVYTVLNATFAKSGGFINAIKTAFTGLIGTQSAAAASSFTMGGAFNSMAKAEVGATIATRGLSTAIKGLMAATGIGIAIAIGATLFEGMSAAADKTAATVDNLGTGIDEFGASGTSAVADVDTGMQTLLQSMTDVENKAKTMSLIFKGSVLEVTEAQADAARLSNATLEGANIDPTFQINKLKAARAEIMKGIAQQQGMGFDTKGLEADVDAIDKKMAGFNATISANEKAIANNNAVLDAWDAKLAAAGGSLDVATGFGETWLTVQQQAAQTELEHAGSLENLAVKMGIMIPETVQGTKAMEEYLGKILGFPVAAGAAAKAEITYSEALVKARNEMLISNEEAAKMAVAKEIAVAHNQLMTASLAGEAAAMATTSAQQQAFNDIIVAGIAGLNEQAAAILTRADANAVATAQTMAAIAAAGEEVIAMTDLGAIYDGSATSLLALVNAKVAGVTAAQTFVTQTELENVALEATTAALLTYITTVEGVTIPPWMPATLENLKAIQQALVTTGNAASVFASQWDALINPSFEAISGPLGEESMNKMKKAIKEMPGFDDFSKKTRKELLDVNESLFKSGQRFEEFQNDLDTMVRGLTTGVSGKAMADLAANMEKDWLSISKLDVGGIAGKFDLLFDAMEQLSGTELRTMLPELIPLIKDLKAETADGGGLTSSEAVSILTEHGEVIKKFPGLYDAIVGSLSEADQKMLKVSESAATVTENMSKLQEILKTSKDEPPGMPTKFTETGDDILAREEGAPPVPGPVKADDFDKKKEAIILEIKTMFTKEALLPAVIPAPDMTAFAQAMNDLLLIPQDFTTKFNAAFVGLVVPAPDLVAFAQAMTDLLLIPADFTTKFNAAFVALIVPAPNTQPFVTGIGIVSSTVLAVATDMSILSTPLAIPAPETSGFTEAFSTMATDATESLQEIVDFLADDLVTAFTEVDSNGISVYVGAVETAETTVTDSLQEVVDFLADDLTTAFEDMQSAAESAAEGAANAMDDVIAAMNSAEEAVDQLISKIKAIPTQVNITVFVGLEGPGVAFLAGGYHGIVDKPTLLVVGEAGAERVDVSPATGPTGGDNLFIQGNDTRTGVTNPLLQKDFGPIGMPMPYTQPPSMAGPVGPMVANITIPVYVNGQYQGTTQTTKILRDMGAFLS